MSIAKLRLTKELKKYNTEDKIDGIIIENTDDIYIWNAQIKGPKETPYENGIFPLRLTFNDDYPVKPPSVKFLVPMYHPNIYSDGKICVDILQVNEWSPSQTIKTILLSISSLLMDPNPESPANRKAAELYMNDRELYNKTVKQYIIDNKLLIV